MSTLTPSEHRRIIDALRPLARLWQPYMARMSPESALFPSADPRCPSSGPTVEEISQAYALVSQYDFLHV